MEVGPNGISLPMSALTNASLNHQTTCSGIHAHDLAIHRVRGADEALHCLGHKHPCGVSGIMATGGQLKSSNQTN